MPGTTISQQISAPREQVFRLATDIDSWPSYINGIARVELLSEGPFQRGLRFKETRVMFGKESTEEMEVTEFDAPSSYLVEAESCGSHFYSRFEFTDSDEGTVVTVKFDAQALSLGAKVLGVLMTPLMKMSVEKCIREDLANLKTFAEQSHSNVETHA